MMQIQRLEAMGYSFTLDANHKIRVCLRGKLAPPPDAEELLKWCREHREEVANALVSRSAQTKTQKKIDVWRPGLNDRRLKGWEAAFDKGLAELVKVVSRLKNGDVERIEVHYVPIAEEWVIESEVNAR